MSKYRYFPLVISGGGGGGGSDDPRMYLAPKSWIRVHNNNSTYININWTDMTFKGLQYSFDGENWNDWQYQDDDGWSYSVSSIADSRRITTNGTDIWIRYEDSMTINFNYTNVYGILNCNYSNYTDISGDIYKGGYRLNGKPRPNQLTIHTDYTGLQFSCICYGGMYDSKIQIVGDRVGYGGLYNGFYYSPITTAPELPATKLSASCYQNLFSGCSYLTTPVPELLAMDVPQQAYAGMYQSCTALTAATPLPATKVSMGTYQNMYYGCSSITEFGDLPARNVASNTYGYMFYNCTSLRKVGVIAMTGNTSYATGQMFTNCTSLEEIEFSATTPPTINSQIWNNMKSDCKIYVPDESVDAYKSATTWSLRANYILPASTRVR